MINIILTQQIKSTTYPLFSDALMKCLTHTFGSPETAGTSSASAALGDAAPHPAATSAEPSSASAPVPLASAQRCKSSTDRPCGLAFCFNKYGNKTGKTYLRCTMGQEHLSGLAIISINLMVSQQLSYAMFLITLLLERPGE